MSQLIEGFLGRSIEGKKSRMPARLDLIQSATGLFLGLFMWVHMAFVSTILVSEDFFNSVVHFLELKFIYDNPIMSYITSALAAIVLTVFFIHAGLAMRKFPINFRQFQILRTHAKMTRHEDTILWMIQAFTGFVMFFWAQLISSPSSQGQAKSTPQKAEQPSSAILCGFFMWFCLFALNFTA